MPKLRVHNFSISIDGYAAGPRQSVSEPLGVGGESLHEWVFPTRTWQRMTGMEGGEEGVDDRLMARGQENIGATIMGRNMFGPIRGEWPDDEWRGWWGDDPVYHHPVFVLTHYAREPIPMQGGTTFYFVTDGIEAALDRAFEAASGKDVQVGGGASTVQQYMRAGLLDEVHVAFAPVLLGSGERLFDNLGDATAGYECAQFANSPSAAHVVLVRRGTGAG